ncbi:hypothetical protein [Acanthopleuribacter pedis]|uniref:Uncharacterized protein n=1 Tax=Acanthopleuribacter pedis TaxID=442870 RepID=A0A8J7U4Y1_9BACT|nr:hypothetical protein [Acanthopleuribacter pedis]MBO1321948.1 hypothetical protein [Acanthopleuribacter pedis]
MISRTEGTAKSTQNSTGLVTFGELALVGGDGAPERNRVAHQGNPQSNPTPRATGFARKTQSA